MAKKEEKVMQFVREQLDSNPDIETSELFERAKKVDASVKKMSLRQFNARYPLQIKRRQTMDRSGPRRSRRSGPRRGRSKAAGTTDRSRDAVRDVFLRFASDLSSAEERKELVQVIARVDRYVDDAIKATR